MISLVIPTLHVGEYLEKCVRSFSSQYDELIVADAPNKTLAENINRGMRLAKGDFIVVSNDDVEGHRGQLADLCHEEKVLSPLVNGSVFKVFHGHMFAIPRKIYAEVGGFDESCPGVYHIDSDYWLRLIRAGYAPEIRDYMEVHHKNSASTISTLDESLRNVEITRQWFIKKWGEQSLSEVSA